MSGTTACDGSRDGPNIAIKTIRQQHKTIIISSLEKSPLILSPKSFFPVQYTCVGGVMCIGGNTSKSFVGQYKNPVNLKCAKKKKHLTSTKMYVLRKHNVQRVSSRWTSWWQYTLDHPKIPKGRKKLTGPREVYVAPPMFHQYIYGIRIK